MDNRGDARVASSSAPVEERYHPAVRIDDLEDQTATAVTIGDWPLLVCRVGGALYAAVNRCPHANAELAGGRVRHGKIICPLHGARFDLATGRCVGDAYPPLKVFQTRVRESFVEVALPGPSP